MKTTIVTGLLGSGKTSFIKNTLSSESAGTVVLVNDFGSLGIDGEAVSAGGLQSVELPSGCVCCTLRTDLLSAIRRIRQEYDPRHLVVEPSGTASASSVISALNDAGVWEMCVVAVVDATEFMDLYEAEIYGPFFTDQISSADVVLLNKSDLADEGLLVRTEDFLSGLNPGGVLMRTVHAAVDISTLTDSTHRIGADEVREHPFAFQSVSVHLGDGASALRMREVFGRLQQGAFGAVVRAKALCMTDEGALRFDLAAGRVHEEVFSKAPESSRLVVIGTGIEELRLRSFLK